MKAFGDFGEFQTDFCENLTDFYQISLKLLVRHYTLCALSLLQVVAVDSRCRNKFDDSLNLHQDRIIYRENTR